MSLVTDKAIANQNHNARLLINISLLRVTCQLGADARRDRHTIGELEVDLKRSPKASQNNPAREDSNLRPHGS